MLLSPRRGVKTWQSSKAMSLRFAQNVDSTASLGNTRLKVTYVPRLVTFQSLPCLRTPWAYRSSSFRSVSQSDLPTKAFFCRERLKMSTLWNECPIKKCHPTKVFDKVISVCLSFLSVSSWQSIESDASPTAVHSRAKAPHSFSAWPSTAATSLILRPTLPSRAYSTSSWWDLLALTTTYSGVSNTQSLD